MNRLFRSLLLSLLLVASGAAIAAEPTQPVERDETATAAEQEHEPDNKIDIHLPSSGNVVVNVWGEARLAANDVADGVIAIFGDAHVDGEVLEAVVTIFGNSYVKGTVHDGVVSLFGNTYIDGEVKEAAVAVFGDLELGPNARAALRSRTLARSNRRVAPSRCRAAQAPAHRGAGLSGSRRPADHPRRGLALRP